MIAVGDKLPAGTLFKIGDAGPETIDAADYFGAGKVVLFSVPGAFTPTCSAKHLPGFIEKEAELKAKGVDKIACFAVNDPFVMKTWGEQQGADAKVDMLSDGNGEYTEALGLTMDGSKFGLGTRSQRFALVAEGGTVTGLYVEAPGAFEVSSAEAVLATL